jgi:hypothetical protein
MSGAKVDGLPSLPVTVIGTSESDKPNLVFNSVIAEL